MGSQRNFKSGKNSHFAQRRSTRHKINPPHSALATCLRWQGALSRSFNGSVSGVVVVVEKGLAHKNILVE